MNSQKENQKIGILGENYAVSYLIKKGYDIVQKNFKKPFGEIDVITKRGSKIIFCEVKASRYFSNSSFSPEFRVNYKKVKKLAKICEYYLLEKKFQSKQSWQVDVISVLIDKDDNLFKLDHFENIEFN